MKREIVYKLSFGRERNFRRSKIAQRLFSAIVILVLLTGCVTVKDTLYLRQAEVSEAINLPPVHLTDSVQTPAIYFSPKLAFQTKKTFTGKIDQIGHNYTDDTSFVRAENSLIWNMEPMALGIDIDIIATRRIAFSLGVNYASKSNSSSVGGYVGIGFYSYNNGSAFRFDAGMQLHTVNYDAYTVVISEVTSIWGSKDSDTYFCHDAGKSTHINPYVNITYNTAFKDWPVNIFFNTGYSIQTLFSFTPRTVYFPTVLINYTQTDQRGESIAGFVHATPGIFFYLGEFSRLLLGARFFYEVQISGTDEKVIFLPMIQIDMHL